MSCLAIVFWPKFIALNMCPFFTIVTVNTTVGIGCIFRVTEIWVNPPHWMHQCKYIWTYLLTLAVQLFRNFCALILLVETIYQSTIFLLILAAPMRVLRLVTPLPFFPFSFFFSVFFWNNEGKPLRAEIYLLHASLPFFLVQLCNSSLVFH